MVRWPKNGPALALAAAAIGTGVMGRCAEGQEAATNVEGMEPITLTSPVGGEEWNVGSSHYITWLAAGPVEAVAIEYSADSGDTWAPALRADGSRATNVSSSAGGTNLFLWKVPAGISSECLIRISNVRAPTMEDESGADFAVVPSQECPDYQWTCLTENAAFAGRDGAGALTFKGKMWLLGGWNPQDKKHFPKICNSEVWSSTDGATWTLELLQAPWEGRHTAGYVVHKDRMWIVGGDTNQRHYQNDVWSSADGMQWDLVNGEVPWAPRALHYTLAMNGKIWVIGGQTMPAFAGGDEVFYNDVWCSEDGATWTQVTDNAPWPHRGMIGGYVVLHDRMWILGGGTYDTPATPTRNFYGDVWSSADGVQWERHVEVAPWQARQYHDVGVFDNRMWVMEGYHKDSGNRNDVWYSADGVNWYELPDTPWAPRHAASVFVYDDGLWMVAGNNMFPDAWKLTRVDQ